MSDESGDEGAKATARSDDGLTRLFQRVSRRAAIWMTGAAALIASGTAIALVSSASPTGTRPTGLESSSTATKNPLDAILAANPDLGQKVPDLINAGTLPNAAYVGDDGTVGGPNGKTAPTTAPFSADSFLAGPTDGAYTLVQLASLALSAGCSVDEAPIAGAIAAAESGGNPGAQGDITLQDATWDWSAGLWQIRGLKSERGTGGLRDSIANADARKNAQAMMIISDGCINWTPWSTYNTGAYVAYLPLMGQAVHAATVYFGRTGSYPPVAATNAAAVTVPMAPARSSRPAQHRSGHRPGRTHAKPGSRNGGSQPRPGASSSSKKVVAPAPAKTSAVPAKTSSAPKLPVPTVSAPKLPKPSLPKPSLPKPSLPKPSLSVPKLPKPSLGVRLPTSGLPGAPAVP